MRLTGDSLSDYLNSFSTEVALKPQLIQASLPLGESGDRYLIQAIRRCAIDPNALVHYVVPCMRYETASDIRDGSHLSLFYLYMFLFGNNIPEELINHIFCTITGVNEITPKEIERQTEKQFECQSYRFIRKRIGTAKGFEYVNNAYEMFDARNVEIGNISRFVDNNGFGISAFAFGFERLVMNQFNTTNIWDIPPFCYTARECCDNIRRDFLRKQAFFNACLDSIASIPSPWRETLL